MNYLTTQHFQICTARDPRRLLPETTLEYSYNFSSISGYQAAEKQERLARPGMLFTQELYDSTLCTV
jgi:hypothetical protein